MLKKILIGVAALGLTAAALANGNTVSESTALAAVPASEFDPGIYLGLQGGYGLSGWKRVEGDAAKVSADGGLSGRAFVGYDFTKYWAMELGYTYFGPKTKVKDASGTVLSQIRTEAWDLVGKGKIPVVDSFDIYGKLGVGYLMSKGIQKASTTFSSDTVYVGEKDKQNNIAGVVGVGAEYYFMPNLWMDLSWTRYMTNAKSGMTYTGTLDSNATVYANGKYQPDADFYALGVAYKFNF